MDVFFQLDVYVSGYFSGDVILELYKNGNVYDGFTYSNSNGMAYGTYAGSFYGIAVNAGDYLEPHVALGGGGNLRCFAGNDTSFTVQLRRLY